MTAVASLAVFTLLLLSGAPDVHAGAVRSDGGFNVNSFPANDDGSLSNVGLGFTINFFGTQTNQIFLNNNGNITFDQALSTFTPFPLLSTNTKIIAPFFADVDTRGVGSLLTKYGSSTIDGHQAFGVNWINVGYYFEHVDKLNSFQLVVIDRSDTGAGNFDFEFNYDQIQWETGDASGGSGGLGGDSARAGWSDGSTHSFEIGGSAIDGALLDSNCAQNGSTGLICHDLNSDVLGRYLFTVRNGVVEGPVTGVPFPGTLVLLGAGILGAGATTLLKRRAK